MRIRRVFFWLHLAAGLLAGLAIAVMATTGTLLAFQKETIAALEHDVRIVLPTGPRLSLDELWQKVRTNEATAKASALTLEAAPNQAALITVGRGEVYWLNPYSGAITSASSEARAFFRNVESWHRTLGLAGQARVWGKSINDAASLFFLFLACSGLYLWWPRAGFRAGWNAGGWFRKLKGKARDWNWHNVFGFWSAPFLIVLTVTALPLSYDWANRVIYALTGTTALPGGPYSVPGSEVTLPPDEIGAPRTREELLAAVEKAAPDWSEITYRASTAAMGGAGRRGEGDRAKRADSDRANASVAATSTSAVTPAPASTNRENHGETKQEDSGEQHRGHAHGRKLSPVTFTVRTSKPWPRMATTTLILDPVSAEILKRENFADQNVGRRVRSWMRFLHTGEALGWPGQFLAGAFSLFSVVLVYTGFALSWRRFFGRKPA